MKKNYQIGLTLYIILSYMGVFLQCFFTLAIENLSINDIKHFWCKKTNFCYICDMGAPRGNQYWKYRNKHGRDHAYTPEKLWDEAVEYFEMVEDNPLLEEKGFAFQGEVTKEDFAKMRAMTIQAFCLFADITDTTWANYCKNKDFVPITTRIRNIIYTQKFEGAAADLLNPNIIAKELGLREHTANENTNTIVTLTPEERAARIAELKKKLNAE